MVRLLTIFSVVILGMSYSSLALSATQEMHLSCKTLSHVHSKYNIPLPREKNNGTEENSLSVSQRYEIFKEYISSKDYDEYECDDALFRLYKNIERSLLKDASEQSKDKAENIASSMPLVPETCLAYREVYIQHMTSKLQEPDTYLSEMVALVDISIQKIMYNQPPDILHKYCNYARKVWARDPNITQKEYHSSKKTYPLTPYCEKEFSTFEDIVFDDFGPAEKDKSIDGWGVLILRGKQIFDYTASGLMERRAWLSLLYKGNEHKMDDACRYNRLN